MTETFDPLSPESRRWQEDFEETINEISQGNYVGRLTRGHAFEACQIPAARSMGAAEAARAYWADETAAHPWLNELRPPEDYH